METAILVGCIQTLNSVIRTRYFYVNQETCEVRDVTIELCRTIADFNTHAKELRKKDEYSMVIPYQYNNGMAEYSFGCGLSHYLQETEFEKLVERSKKPLSFPLTECRISMYTPSDVKHILSCRGVFDASIEDALKHRFGLEKIA
jgi:hypothetical protein